MSADPHAAAHGHDDHGGAPHGTRRSYLTGFALSVVLTAIPFGLVMGGWLSSVEWTIGICMALAFVQIIVHMIYFLHMNSKSEQGWTMMALIFTTIIIVIALAGTLWVMYHMNVNMMPDMGMSGGM
jgi:cytochrome o ubiquinol oxidase operon protein cyoD